MTIRTDHMNLPGPEPFDGFFSGVRVQEIRPVDLNAHSPGKNAIHQGFVVEDLHIAIHMGNHGDTIIIHAHLGDIVQHNI